MTANPIVTLMLTSVVVATAVALLSKDIRPPTPAESAAYLVVTASSYLLSELLPPALAILYAVIAIKAYPHMPAEQFTVGAPHAPVQPNNQVSGYADGLLQNERVRPASRKPMRVTLATPEAQHAAQTADV